MSQNLTPSRVPTPGKILSRELEARGWTQKDLAEIIGRPVQTINEIIRGTKQIRPETAIELSQVLGTSAEFWTNLEAKYRLHLASKEKKEEETEQNITRKSRLYTILPMSELIKNGWIKKTDSIDTLEQQVCNFCLWHSVPRFAPTVAPRFFLLSSTVVFCVFFLFVNVSHFDLHPHPPGNQFPV